MPITAPSFEYTDAAFGYVGEISRENESLE